MKKILLLIPFLLGNGIGLLFVTNPIPSYNVLVDHVANFQENSRGNIRSLSLWGKRYMVVKVKGLTSSSATIWVYSLDEQDILGPYTVYGGETIWVEIDEREWGVIVQSDDHVEVNVWIVEEAKTAGGQKALPGTGYSVSSCRCTEGHSGESMHTLLVGYRREEGKFFPQDFPVTTCRTTHYYTGL